MTTKQMPLTLGEPLTRVRKGQRVTVAGVTGTVIEVTPLALRHILPDFWLRPDANHGYELGCKIDMGVHLETSTLIQAD